MKIFTTILDCLALVSFFAMIALIAAHQLNWLVSNPIVLGIAAVLLLAALLTPTSRARRTQGR